MGDTQPENSRKVTIDIGQANVFALAIFVISAIVFLVLYYFLWPEQWSLSFISESGFGGYMLFFVLMLVGIVVHELIHGISWAFFAPGGWKSISFGVLWKVLTPYCHCDEPMSVRGYIVGAMMPCVLLGLVPAIVALCIGHLPTLIWGIFFIAAAAGDIWMSWLLTKEDPKSRLLDHPSEAGFYILD